MRVEEEGEEGTYVAFLDVSKAYDTVWREGLWKKMEQYGIEEKFVQICRGLYGGVEASVVLEVMMVFSRNKVTAGVPIIPTSIQHLRNGNDGTVGRENTGNENGGYLVWRIDVCG